MASVQASGFPNGKLVKSGESFSMEGQCFACICPFQDGSEGLDKPALCDYLKFLWSRGGRNIVINGTSAEFSAMTLQERKTALEAARSVWPVSSDTGRPSALMNNVSSCCLADSLELLSHSQSTVSTPQGDRTLADAILILPPFYLAGVPEKGIYAFLQRFLKECQLPVFLYNFPANTNCLISPETYTKLAGEFPLLRGIKNTFEDTALAMRFKKACPHLQVYVGADKLSVETLDNGMDGVIGGGGSSVLAYLFVDIWHAHRGGDRDRAKALQDRMNAWTAEREKAGLLDIPGGKAGLRALVPSVGPTCRAPLVQATQAQTEALNRATQTALRVDAGELVQ